MPTYPDPKSPDVLPIASISGGKDSAALSLHLTEQGIEHRRVFADTGWEHDHVYESFEYLSKKLGPIDVVRSDERDGCMRWGMCETEPEPSDEDE